MFSFKKYYPKFKKGRISIRAGPSIRQPKPLVEFRETAFDMSISCF
jgi:hypothetical protein